MSIHPDSDSLVDLLGQRPPAGVGHELRAALLLQTTRVIRRRLWIKRGSVALALAACYVAGLLTMHWAVPGRGDQEFPTASNQRPPHEKPSEAESRSEPQEPPAEASPETLEQWGPLVDLDKRAALYRRAGDRYYADNNDLQGALRCYRLALDSGSERDLQIAVNDNWLLIALKEARTKEKRNATN